MDNQRGVREARAYSLYAPSGARKYINSAERARFLQAANTRDPALRALCLMLVYTGCRLSEGLNLTADAVQADNGTIAIVSLKKRRTGLIREVPVPDALIEAIVRTGEDFGGGDHIWPWRRTWAWTLVKRVMAQAGIAGIHATPKGLRHGFAIHALECGIPLTMIQKWLGHAQLATTAIYANAVGPEERNIAAKMW